MEDKYDFYKSEIWENIKNGTITENLFINQVGSLLAQAFIASDPKRRARCYTNVMESARYFDIESEVKQLAKEKAAEYGEQELWEIPKSFEKLVKPTAFPVKSLPPLLRDYLQAVSDYVQVEPEMAVLPLLSVLALCVQGKALVRNAGSDHTEPLNNLYTLTVAPPGERKSGCLREFIRPVEEFQRRYNEMHAPKIREYISERAFWENKKLSAMKGKDADFSAVKSADREIEEIDRKLEKIHKIMLTISDTTPEALAIEMSKQGERMGIVDSEGAVFDVLSGIYSNGKVNIEIFLKAYDGEATNVTRCGKTVELHSPLLTIGLMTQPEHFMEAMENRQFTGRGLMYRFWFSFPESRAGYLKMTGKNIPPELKKRYKNLIEKLLEMPVSEVLPVIICDKEAEILFSDYFEQMQKKMREGGIFENLKEWASKQFARALRIAGILHLCEHEATEKLTGQTAQRAVKIAEWAENHALKAMSGTASEPTEIKNAKYILKKLKKSEKIIFSKSELLRFCQTLKAYEFDAPLEILEDMGYIRIEIIRSGERGKPKERIKINPNIKYF